MSEQISKPDNLLELTQAYIEKWQSLGLMPELAPGEVLVWKHTRHRKRPYFENQVLCHDCYYEGMFDKSELRVGATYEHDGCTVTANPLSFQWYTNWEDKDEYGVQLALRVPKDLLRLTPTHENGSGNSFYAPHGVPISAYNVAWFRHHEVQLYLREGDDVLDLLSDPLACMGDDYIPKEKAQWPPHPSLPVKKEAWKECKMSTEAKKYDVISTARAIELWQQRGMMPEVSPGKILVWKGTFRMGKFRGSVPQYRTAGYFDSDAIRLWLGTPFDLPELDVSASWEDTVWWEPEDDYQLHLVCLALLVDRDTLTYESLTHEDDFDTELSYDFEGRRGVPVACYEAAPIGTHEQQKYALRLIEGEDALEWLP